MHLATCCSCSDTFHAIVGEAFTELVHHYEADAEWVVGSTKFLRKGEKWTTFTKKKIYTYSEWQMYVKDSSFVKRQKTFPDPVISYRINHLSAINRAGWSWWILPARWSHGESLDKRICKQEEEHRLIYCRCHSSPFKRLSYFRTQRIQFLFRMIWNVNGAVSNESLFHFCLLLCSSEMNSYGCELCCSRTS